MAMPHATPQPVVQEKPAGPNPAWTLIATSFGLGMALLDVTAGNVAVPSIQADLHTGMGGLSWVIDAYTLSFASLLLLAGGLGDRLGAKRVFVAGLLVFTLASALCGLAPDASSLIAARLLQGLGAALFMPASLAILARAYPDKKKRAHAIGVWSALTALAASSGPLVGGLLVASLGWRSIFLVNVPVGIIGVLMALRFVPRTPPAGARGLDLPAQLVAALSLASITWALIERGERGWHSAPVLFAFFLGLLGLALFVWLERVGRSPMLPPSLFQNRTFSATAAGALLYAAGFFGGLLVLSLYFQRVQGETAALAGLHITAITATFGVTSILGGRLAGRYGPRRPILTGLGLLATGALGLSFVPADASFSLVGPLLVVVGFGAGLVAAPMNAAILGSVPPAQAGIGSGVLNAARQIGTALGVAVFASFFHETDSVGAVHLAMGCAAGLYLAALGVVSFSRDERAMARAPVAGISHC
jgi:MFS transporter, DHA2 family, methylenomycin A resistance protein